MLCEAALWAKKEQDCMLELTTKFSGISTSPRAQKSFSPAMAAANAAANLRYITRDTAAAEVQYHGVFMKPDGSPAETPREMKAAMRRAMEERSTRGGKSGVRVAEKVIFSLPNDFGPQAQSEALNLICETLSRHSESVLIIGAIHRDKSKNLHGHLLAKDGLESRKSAQERNPGALRIRQKEVMRMGDYGQKKKMRALFADCINQVADKYGLTRVEHRSYKTRGVEIEPTEHEGPPRRARTAKTGKLEAVQRRNKVKRKLRAQIKTPIIKAVTAVLSATDPDGEVSDLNEFVDDLSEFFGELILPGKRCVTNQRTVSKPLLKSTAHKPLTSETMPNIGIGGMSPIEDIFGPEPERYVPAAQSVDTYERAIEAAHERARRQKQKKAMQRRLSVMQRSFP